MRTIFHLTDSQTWEKYKDSDKFEAESLRTEGFIHLSRPHQIHGVVKRYFQNTPNLILLQVNQELVTFPIKYEGAADDKFPHIYGPINSEAIIGVFELKNSSGEFKLPVEFQLVGDTLIRRGRPGDEPEITSVHIHAWQQSYIGLIPDSVLAARPLSFAMRLNERRSSLKEPGPWATFVAESAKHGIIGFCSSGPAREADLKNYGEVGAIYCLNEYKGKGIGAAMLRAAHAQQMSAGYSHSFLWVLEGNPTIDFYLKMGGIQTSKKKQVNFGGKLLTEFGFEWKL